MGYRPTIKILGQKKPSIELGKFYGYIYNLRNQESIKYLLDQKLITDDDVVMFEIGYYYTHIVMSSEQFKKFIDKYQQDIRDYDWTKTPYTYPEDFKISDYYSEFEKIYNDERPKIVTWG